MSELRVGTVLYGAGGGYFDGYAWEDLRVEAVGADWVVARDSNGRPQFAAVNPHQLERFTVPRPEGD